MKKTIIFLITGSILYSCSNGELNRDAIKKQIADYKKEQLEISEKIVALEKQLDSSAGEKTFGTKTAVKTEVAKEQTFSHYFEATGELESVSEAFISPEVGGQVTEMSVTEGQRVSKGQLLAKLNTTVIEKNISEIKTRLELAEIIYNKQKELWGKNIGSERQYLEAKNNFESLQNNLNSLRAQYNKSIIQSPIDGFVEQIMLKKGELASPGMQLMQIVNLDQLYVNTKLSETYLSAIELGDTVEINFPSFPHLILKKPVYRISNVVNKQNRTFEVQVIIDNPDRLLKPNLLANIKINDYYSPSSVVLPSILVKEDLKGKYIFVAENNDNNWQVKKRYVETGISYKSKTEIVSGLEAGQLFITDGYSNVSDGMFVDLN